METSYKAILNNLIDDVSIGSVVWMLAELCRERAKQNRDTDPILADAWDRDRDAATLEEVSQEVGQPA